MSTLKDVSKQIASNKAFELFITLIILVNSILIGVQVTHDNAVISMIQHVILYIFTFEIIVRIIAADSFKEFVNNGWNMFDLFLVLIGWIPVTATSGSTMMALRVLRVFRVLRLLRTAKELKLIVNVLIKSMRSISYNAILFLIFTYLYAVAGVSLFRLPDPATLQGEELARYEQLMETAPHSPANSPDPFGTIGEAFFTLFRAVTGEDWTDLRYNLVSASELGVIDIPPTFATVFLVSWFCIAAFLLLNLVTGAVINNYQVSIEEEAQRRKAAKANTPPAADMGEELSPRPGLELQFDQKS